MKEKTILWIILCLLFSGCAIATSKKIQSQSRGISVEKEPYGKYSLETADVQVWFYDEYFIYLDRNQQVLKPYETVDTESK